MKKPNLPEILRRRRKRNSNPYPDLPEQVPMEALARACMQGPPKKRWRYLREADDEQRNAANG